MRAQIAVVAILVAAPIAHADDEIVRGSVVKVEAAEIYVNLGRDRAIEDGSALRIKRTIKLQHPITRAGCSGGFGGGCCDGWNAAGRVSRLPAWRAMRSRSSFSSCSSIAGVSSVNLTKSSRHAFALLLPWTADSTNAVPASASSAPA